MVHLCCSLLPVSLPHSEHSFSLLGPAGFCSSVRTALIVCFGFGVGFLWVFFFLSLVHQLCFPLGFCHLRPAKEAPSHKGLHRGPDADHVLSILMLSSGLPPWPRCVPTATGEFFDHEASVRASLLSACWVKGLACLNTAFLEQFLQRMIASVEETYLCSLHAQDDDISLLRFAPQPF